MFDPENKTLYIIPLVEICYILLALIINALVVVVTIRTWHTVYDHIHVRGELILQTAVLWIHYIIALFIYILHWKFEGGKEHYDEVFYFAYFTNSSISCLLSIIIGTQWRCFAPRKQLVSSPRRGSVTADIAFQAVVASDRGLEVFMDHLAKRNEQNYLIVKGVALRFHEHSETTFLIFDCCFICTSSPWK